MKTKICTGSQVNIGCGKPKPISDFQLDGRSGAHYGICRKCLKDHRDSNASKKNPAVDANLYNQFNVRW